MKEKIIKKVELENGQTIVLSDVSRKVAKDSYFVAMNARMEIQVKKNLFSAQEQKELFIDDVVEKLGNSVVYEHTAERKFILTKDKDKLFETLIKDFFANLGQYISKPDFPKKFILKQYKDIVDNKLNKLKVV